MTTDVRISPDSAALPVKRWLGLAAGLAGEFLGLRAWVDAERLPESLAGLGVLSEAYWLPLLIAMGGAPMLLLCGDRLRETFLAICAEPVPPERAWRWLVAQLGSYAALLGISGVIFRGEAAPPGPPLLWAAALLGSIGVFALCTAGAAVPLRPLYRNAPRLVGPALLGAGTGGAAWLAAYASSELWRPLSDFTLRGVAVVLSAFTSDLVVAPAQRVIGIRDFVVEVGPPCSGYQGIGLIVVFLTVYLLALRKQLRFPNALVLLPLSLAIVMAGNVLRIAALIGVGALYSPEVAVSGFHARAGWLFFCAIALGIVFATRRWSFLALADGPAVAKEEGADEGYGPTAAYLMPELCVIAAGLLTALFAVSFNALYGVAIGAGCAALYVYRAELPRPQWRPAWEPVAIGAGVFAIWMLAQPEPDAGRVESWRGELMALPPALGIAWLCVRVLGSVVVVPLVEELAFRGYLLRRLIAVRFTDVSPKRFTWLSFVASSLAFGALHQRWIVGTLAGAAFAFAVYRRGRLGDAVVAHAVANALIAAAVLATGNWSLWI